MVHLQCRDDWIWWLFLVDWEGEGRMLPKIYCLLHIYNKRLNGHIAHMRNQTVQQYFCYKFVIISPRKKAWPLIWKLNFLYPKMFLSRLVEIGLVVLDNIISKFCQSTFTFCYDFPLEKIVAFIWTKLDAL